MVLSSCQSPCQSPAPRASAGHAYQCTVMGICLRFESNSAQLVHWIAQAFPQHQCSAQQNQGLIRITIRPDNNKVIYQRPLLEYRVSDNILEAESKPVSLRADAFSGEASASVDASVLDDKEFFLTDVVQCLSLFLICGRGRFPVHAAAVRSGDTTLLLSGNSGFGKSSLAYACMRRGWELVSEDTVFLDIQSGVSAWSNPRFIHLLPAARDRFPELAGLPALQLPNGKTKIRIPVADKPCLPATGLVLCRLIPRHSLAASRWRRAVASEVVAWMLDSREPGFDLAAEARALLGVALGELPAVNLEIGHDADGLEETMQDIVHAVAR